MIDLQGLYELSEEFKTQMSADLKNVTSQNDTLDKLNSKIVKSIMSFMESKCKSIYLKKSKLNKETLDLISSRVEKNGKKDSVEYVVCLELCSDIK